MLLGVAGGGLPVMVVRAVRVWVTGSPSTVRVATTVVVSV